MQVWARLIWEGQAVATPHGKRTRKEQGARLATRPDSRLESSTVRVPSPRISKAAIRALLLDLRPARRDFLRSGLGYYDLRRIQDLCATLETWGLSAREIEERSR